MYFCVLYQISTVYYSSGKCNLCTNLSEYLWINMDRGILFVIWLLGIRIDKGNTVLTHTIDVYVCMGAPYINPLVHMASYSRTIVPQVMAPCLTVLRHYLNQWYFNYSKVQYHSMRVISIFFCHQSLRAFASCVCNIAFISDRGQWVKRSMIVTFRITFSILIIFWWYIVC